MIDDSVVVANNRNALMDFYHNAEWKANPVLSIFAAVGGLWTFRQALRFANFCRIYLYRGNTLSRYIRSSSNRDQTWALITGASDGIGKGFAQELCSRGINVILHGRNSQKLQTVQTELLNRYPNIQIRLLILDANTDVSKTTALDLINKSVADIPLRILINNVGSTPTPLWSPLIHRSSSDITHLINTNALFPTEITRLLLPHLTLHQPSLILNVGSGASDFSCPYISVLAGTKSYTQTWSRSLNLEMRAENTNIEVLHLQVGMVQSNSARRETSFLVPSSRVLARSALDVVGCGREAVWPYWPHALQFGLIGALPVWVRNRIILGIAAGERKLEQEELSAVQGGKE